MTRYSKSYTVHKRHLKSLVTPSKAKEKKKSSSSRLEKTTPSTTSTVRGRRTEPRQFMVKRGEYGAGKGKATKKYLLKVLEIESKSES